VPNSDKLCDGEYGCEEQSGCVHNAQSNSGGGVAGTTELCSGGEGVETIRGARTPWARLAGIVEPRCEKRFSFDPLCSFSTTEPTSWRLPICGNVID
jgi:hypothetical protein